MNTAGDITSLKSLLQAGVKPIVFTREVKLKKTEIEKYIGEYAIGSRTIKIYTKPSGSLFMFIAGQPEYELMPLGKNKFALKNLAGFSVKFEINKEGKVKDLLSIQPNGIFKAVKKK